MIFYGLWFLCSLLWVITFLDYQRKNNKADYVDLILLLLILTPFCIVLSLIPLIGYSTKYYFQFKFWLELHLLKYKK